MDVFIQLLIKIKSMWPNLHELKKMSKLELLWNYQMNENDICFLSRLAYFGLITSLICRGKVGLNGYKESFRIYILYKFNRSKSLTQADFLRRNRSQQKKVLYHAKHVNTKTLVVSHNRFQNNVLQFPVT